MSSPSTEKKPIIPFPKRLPSLAFCNSYNGENSSRSKHKYKPKVSKDLNYKSLVERKSPKYQAYTKNKNSNIKQQKILQDFKLQEACLQDLINKCRGVGRSTLVPIPEKHLELRISTKEALLQKYIEMQRKLLEDLTELVKCVEA